MEAHNNTLKNLFFILMILLFYFNDTFIMPEGGEKVFAII